MAPTPAFHHALDNLSNLSKKYSLDISGVAGFFGGNVAVAAMGTVHIYRGRKWLGWYNSPGSYEIAHSYGVICRSRVWDGLYPGVNVDPARLFQLDGKEGPPFRAVLSGTIMSKTGHLASLLMEECIEAKPHTADVARGRVSQLTAVSVMNLRYVPEKTVMEPTLGSGAFSTILSLSPIVITVVAAIMCILVADDWWSFGVIVYGAVASGLSCLAIGSAKLCLNHPKPAAGAPRGDGILGETGSDLVVLLGEEGAVNVITRGSFSLNFSGAPQYHLVGVCSLLLTIQFLGQLLIIPLGTLFGQLMFLASLFASWMYTAYLASIDRYSLQRQIVDDKILHNPTRRKYQFGTRTAMSVFILLVIRARYEMSVDKDSPRYAEIAEALEKVLVGLLPNDTPVWKAWRTAVLPLVISGRSERVVRPEFEGDGKGLLEVLCQDADDALAFYYDEQREPERDELSATRPSDSSRQTSSPLSKNEVARAV